MKMLFAICVLFALVPASFCAPISSASLKGKYSFQLSNSHLDWWNVSLTCFDQQNQPYTVNAGGSDLSNESVVGVLTFDAKGNVTGTFTQYGKFDQAASAATAVASCSPGASNGGYPVYDLPSNGTLTGTYSVQTTGLGGMVLSISGGDTVNMVLEVAGTAAVRNIVFMTGYDPTTHRVDASGSAILQ